MTVRDDVLGPFYAIMAVLVLALMAGVSGMILASRVEHAAAIKAGVGRWECDRATGETRFRYGVVRSEAGR